MRNGFPFAFAGTLIWSVLLSSVGFSQTYGTISGLVTDASNAAVARATVTLKNLEQGATQEIKTNEAGLYRFSLLPPGHYDISATALSFAVYTVSNVELQVNSNVRQ